MTDPTLDKGIETAYRADWLSHRAGVKDDHPDKGIETPKCRGWKSGGLGVKDDHPDKGIETGYELAGLLNFQV